MHRLLTLHDDKMQWKDIGQVKEMVRKRRRKYIFPRSIFSLYLFIFIEFFFLNQFIPFARPRPLVLILFDFVSLYVAFIEA